MLIQSNLLQENISTKRWLSFETENWNLVQSLIL